MDTSHPHGSDSGGIVAMTLTVPSSQALNSGFNLTVNSNNSPNGSGTVDGSNGSFTNLPSSVTPGSTYNDVIITAFTGQDDRGSYATVTLSQSGCSNQEYNIYQSS